MRRAFPAFVLLGLGLALAAALSEIVLRLLGPWPLDSWAAELRQDKTYPVLHEPDPVLGWRTKPGVYEWEAVRDGTRRRLRATILDDGSRATARHSPDPGEPTLIFVGGSYTHGWELSDEETFPWRVQESHPALRVLNYGTGAYGTYQSLLVLQRHFSERSPARFVLYGMIGHHSIRNVASRHWLLGLMSPQQGVPYCTIGERDDLLCHAPRRRRWLLAERLAVVSFAEVRYGTWQSSARDLQKWIVTKKLVAEMARLSRSSNAEFGVVFFEKATPWKTRFLKFLAEDDIAAMDCGNSGRWDTISRPWGGGGHPTAQENRAYARCISAELESRYGVDRR